MEPLTPAELALITRYGWGPRTISYSFYVDDDLPDYWTDIRLQAIFGSNQDQVKAITTAQRQAFDAAMGLWKSVSNVQLVEETQGIGDIFVARIPFDSGPGAVDENAQAAVIPLISVVARAASDLRGGDGAVTTVHVRCQRQLTRGIDCLVSSLRTQAELSRCTSDSGFLTE